MLPETTQGKQQPTEFIIHWAQWFTITHWRLFNAPAGTDERRKAYNVHAAAGQQLINAVGIQNDEAHHG